MTVKDLYTVIIRVGDYDITGRGDGYGTGSTELSVLGRADVKSEVLPYGGGRDCHHSQRRH